VTPSLGNSCGGTYQKKHSSCSTR